MEFAGWLVVGQATPRPEKRMDFVNWDDEIRFPLYGKIRNRPNHQADGIFHGSWNGTAMGC